MFVLELFTPEVLLDLIRGSEMSDGRRRQRCDEGREGREAGAAASGRQCRGWPLSSPPQSHPHVFYHLQRHDRAVRTRACSRPEGGAGQRWPLLTRRLPTHVWSTRLKWPFSTAAASSGFNLSTCSWTRLSTPVPRLPPHESGYRSGYVVPPLTML